MFFSLLYNTNNLIAIQHCEITELNALKEPLIDILAPVLRKLPERDRPEIGK